jgi:hypothetical protein
MHADRRQKPSSVQSSELSPHTRHGCCRRRFKAFHERYYHPSNGRFWFYGDDPPQERLRLLGAFLDEFEARPVDSAVTPQPLFSVRIRVPDKQYMGCCLCACWMQPAECKSSGCRRAALATVMQGVDKQATATDAWLQAAGLPDVQTCFVSCMPIRLVATHAAVLQRCVGA